MSATLETDKIVSFFTNNSKQLSSQVIRLQGRFHPIEIYNLQTAVQHYLATAKDTILQIHFTLERGDIIVFLTGQEEIEDLAEELQKTIENNPSLFEGNRLQIAMLFSALPTDKQQLAFAKTDNCRKVILATNIAETAITIEGVRFVVDCENANHKHFVP